MPSYINQFGDWVRDYIVEMGHPSDFRSRLVREVTAKCDYLAVESAERTTPGYIAFNVYPAKGRRIEAYYTPGPETKRYVYIDDIIDGTENGLDVDLTNAVRVFINEGRITEVSKFNQVTGVSSTEYYGREV